MIVDQNGQPTQPLQQQPQFPMTGVNIPPDGSGMVITIILAPGFQFSTTLDENAMNAVCAKWVQTRKNIADQLRVIEHVKSTKL